MIEAMNFVLWISSGFSGKDPTVFSPVSTALNEMISLRNKLLKKIKSESEGSFEELGGS